MARQYKSYDKDFKKTIVNLYENGKGIYWRYFRRFKNLWRK